LIKPIRPRLLISKIQSLLRRVDRLNPQIATSNRNLVINRNKYVIELNGAEICLPKKEFELLDLLASRPGVIFTRDQIMSTIWGNVTIVGERTIDVHIRKLREKLGDDYIRTMKGVGYKFSEN
ncbi:MAG: response regulator transcription factor, partial [Bacteroidetes bacterium]|nr:response regulator transcription factor [Bacteroidota bacterium]